VSVASGWSARPARSRTRVAHERGAPPAELEPVAANQRGLGNGEHRGTDSGGEHEVRVAPRPGRWRIFRSRAS
jgi:hypothetical protein